MPPVVHLSTIRTSGRTADPHPVVRFNAAQVLPPLMEAQSREIDRHFRSIALQVTDSLY
jgi:hypothetical protein